MKKPTEKELKSRISELEALVEKQTADFERMKKRHADTKKKLSHTRESLNEMDERFHSLFHQPSVGILFLDTDGNITDANKAIGKIFGIPSKDLSQYNAFKFFKNKKMLQAINESLSGKISFFEGEYVSILNGKKLFLIVIFMAQHDINGNVIGCIGIVQDKTEFFYMQQSLKESENRYQFLFTQPTMGIVYLDADGVIVDTNEAFSRIIGFPYDKLVGLNVIESATNNQMVNAVKKALTGKITTYNGEYVTKIGHKTYLHAVMQPPFDDDGNVTGGVGIFEDLSDRIKAEDAHKKSEEMLRSVYRTVPIGIGVGADRKIIMLNESFLKFTGYSADELIGQNTRILYPDNNEYKRAGKLIYDNLEKEKIKTSEVKFKRKDGEIIDVLISSSLLNPKDPSMGVTLSFIDITDRKKAENNLKYHLALETAVSEISKIFITPDTVDIDNMLKIIGSAVSADRAYLFRFSDDLTMMSNINEWCARGIKPEIDNLQNIDSEAIPWWMNQLKNHESIIIEDMSALPHEASDIKMQLEQQNIKSLVAVPIILKKNILWGFMGFDETKYQRKWQSFEIQTLQVICDMVARYIGRIHTEKERKQLEMQLLHSQKMESIGRLAGGIAHDFNNTLTGIMGYAELLKMKFEDTDSLEGEAASVILEGTERAANLTKQLLGFARGGKYRPVALNINEVIKNTNKLIEKSFSKDIRLTFHLDGDIEYVKADKTQMEQILTNLIINAKDAMPKGGHLIYETENVSLDDSFGEQYAHFIPGKYVKFSVMDTGIGIPKNLHKKVFEPFFTTKEQDERLGFGLATVYGIVKNHEGYVELFSEPDEGTRISVYLPSIKDEEIAIADNSNTPLKKSDGETILLVDDEEEVRNVTRLQLEMLGYKVISASSGAEAISIYRSRYNEIALALLDVVMPDMDGLETYKKLKQSNPDIKTIVMSGFSKMGKASDLIELGAKGFVQKPFRLANLSETIDRILNT